MLKPTILSTLFILGFASAHAQSKPDVLHLLEGPKEVQVKEIGFNSIKYSLPNETAVYEVSKYQVTKIEFGSGREEVFRSPFKNVNGVNDAKEVFITYIPEDVSGLYPKGDLFSKATGVTSLSSINTVKNRALDKLKAEAAMVGANVILIGDMYQRGNEYPSENQVGNSTQTTYSGVAYSSEKLDAIKTQELIQSQSYHHFQTHYLNRNAWAPELSVASKFGPDQKPILFQITEVIERDGELFVKVPEISAKSKELKIIYASDDTLMLMERNDKVTTNYFLVSEKNKSFKTEANRVVL